MNMLMKRIFIILALLVAVCGAVYAAGKAEIKFETTNHDFGTIHEKDGPVSTVYTFTNTGDAPLTIVAVSNGGCGCTKPQFTMEPIAPGKTGEIKITFDPTGRKGEFNRTVKVRTNAGNGRSKLTFSGVIVK